VVEKKPDEEKKKTKVKTIKKERKGSGTDTSNSH